MGELLQWLAWLVVPSLLAAYFLSLREHARRGLPPGPRPLPLIGNLHLLGDQPHRSLARLAKIHGPLMSLRLGAVTTVVASSPEVAREFLRTHDAVFATRSVPDAISIHAKNSVVWMPKSSARWRALKKVMSTELFAPHRLDALQHLRREKVQRLVDHVGRQARDGGGGGAAAVDIGRVAFATVLNLLSSTMFSRDLTNLDDHGESKEFQELVTELMEVAGSPNLSDFYPALAAADVQGVRRRGAKLVARLHRVFDEEIDRRLRGREDGEPRKKDFLELLLDSETGDRAGTGALDRDTLRTIFSLAPTNAFSPGRRPILAPPLPAEGGGLGFLCLSGYSAQLWTRKTDSDGSTGWVLGRTIELDKLLPLNQEDEASILIFGFTEEGNVSFLVTNSGVFMVQLESGQFKKPFKLSIVDVYHPFTSVYTAGTGIGGGHDGAELLHNT